VSGFKRVSLAGSEELFRPTRPAEAEDTDEVIREVVDRRPPEKVLRTLSFTPEEVELLVEAIQVAKYADKPRPKPSLDRFEKLDELKVKLQGEAQGRE